MKTYMANPDKIERKWYVVDATGYTLGRLASEVAKVLRGKNKPQFTPHVDTGDYVIVVNAEKIKVTGKKLEQKIYIWKLAKNDFKKRYAGSYLGAVWAMAQPVVRNLPDRLSARYRWKPG